MVLRPRSASPSVRSAAAGGATDLRGGGAPRRSASADLARTGPNVRPPLTGANLVPIGAVSGAGSERRFCWRSRSEAVGHSDAERPSPCTASSPHAVVAGSPRAPARYAVDSPSPERNTLRPAPRDSALRSYLMWGRRSSKPCLQWVEPRGTVAQQLRERAPSTAAPPRMTLDSVAASPRRSSPAASSGRTTPTRTDSGQARPLPRTQSEPGMAAPPRNVFDNVATSQRQRGPDRSDEVLRALRSVEVVLATARRVLDRGVTMRSPTARTPRDRSAPVRMDEPMRRGGRTGGARSCPELQEGASRRAGRDSANPKERRRAAKRRASAKRK